MRYVYNEWRQIIIIVVNAVMNKCQGKEEDRRKQKLLFYV